MGSIGFLVEFQFHMVVLGVGRGSIGFVAPWRFKPLDSQPEKSNMVQFRLVFMIFELFRKVTTTLWPGIYRVVGLELSENNFRVF